MLERIKQVSEAARLLPHGQGRWSQLGEDVILKYIADELGITSGVFVDIGAGDGQSMSNSFLFRGLGWLVYAYDGAHKNALVNKRFFVGSGAIIVHPDVGYNFSTLSIDIDGQDYWVLRSIGATHLPDIICCEFNGCIQQSQPQTVPLDDSFKHDASDYYGANLAAFKRLLVDYTLVFHHHSQNAFFVHKSFNAPEFTEPVVRQQYHPHSPGREWVML